MNEKGREVLVRAALDGVPQITGRFSHGNARCGLGVLGEALGVLQFYGSNNYAALNVGGEVQMARAYELGERVACPECGVVTTGYSLISHLNDLHRYDFIKLARAL